MSPTLRPYQQFLVDGARNALADGHQRVLVQAPTGSGKTVVFCFIASNVTTNGKRTMILVHRRELIKQTSAKLVDNGVPHGIIQAGFTGRAWEPVQIASVQTLVNRLDKYHEPDYVILDEAHHTCSPTWRKVLQAYPNARVLGFTATPCRLDGKGLGTHFETLVTGPTIEELTTDGYLAPTVVYAPGGIDVSGVHTQAGDFKRNELATAADKPRIVGDALAHYRKHADRLPAIAFCVSVEAAEHFAQAARDAGYAAASIDGKLDQRTRDERISDLATGRLHILTSCDLISEGVDVPVVSCGILLRPTQSLGLYMQQVGRLLRPAPGKTAAIILDHAGNTLRHGLPDTPRRWSLDAGAVGAASEDPAIAVRQCARCYHCHRPRPSCPACGYVYPVQSREVEQVDGELQRVDPAQLRIQWHRERPEVSDLRELERVEHEMECRPGWALNQWLSQGHDLTVSELREHAERVRQLRGYKRGWVEHFLKYHGQKVRARAAAQEEV